MALQYISGHRETKPERVRQHKQHLGQEKTSMYIIMQSLRVLNADHDLERPPRQLMQFNLVAIYLVSSRCCQPSRDHERRAVEQRPSMDGVPSGLGGKAIRQLRASKPRVK